jgi:hypothetical protein
VWDAETGDGERICKVRLWDKLKALELLARHFGMFKTEIELNVHVDEQINQRIAAGRKRAAERNATEVEGQ